MGYKIFLISVISVIIISIITLIIFTISSNRKLKSRLTNSFGKIPNELDYDIERAESYHYFKIQQVDNSHFVDDITWDDLDIDDVFRRINVCLTSIGEEYLFDVMHEPKFENEPLLDRGKLITYLKEHPTERLELQMCLAKLGKSDYNGLSSYVFNSKSKSLKYPLAYKILAIISAVSIIIIPFNLLIGIICLLTFSIINGVVYYFSKRNIEVELTTIRYFSTMLWCCNEICKMKNSELSVFTSEMREKFKVFKYLQGKLSGIMQKSFSDLDFIIEYIKILFLFDLINYNAAVHKISKHKDDFHALYKAVGELDLAICVLSFRESLPFYTTPVFSNENCVKFNEIYHPLLSSPISNSGMIKNDSVITGSNASGKSTFIKAIAVNSILAQTIHTCVAKEYTIRFSLVITSMAARDDISEGDSYFITEIKSLKRIIDKIQDVHCTCFIDEILKGTNTIERIAASASVLKYLHNTDCMCMVASHDIELTDILKDQYDNYNFCEQITTEGIFFDYKLKEGASQTRNAIKLLDFMNFDSNIVENVERLVDKFESTKSW